MLNIARLLKVDNKTKSKNWFHFMHHTNAAIFQILSIDIKCRLLLWTIQHFFNKTLLWKNWACESVKLKAEEQYVLVTVLSVNIYKLEAFSLHEGGIPSKNSLNIFLLELSLLKYWRKCIEPWAKIGILKNDKWI